MKRLQPQFIIVIAALTLGLAGGPTIADTVQSHATASVVLDEHVRARSIADPDPLVVVNVLEDGLEASCRLRALRAGEERKRVRGVFNASLVDANTLVEIQRFETTRHLTDENGEARVAYSIPMQANFAQQVALIADVDVGGRKRITEVHYSCELTDPTP